MSDFVSLRIRSLIADKEMVTEQARLDLARGGEWMSDYAAWHGQLDAEIQELFKQANADPATSGRALERLSRYRNALYRIAAQGALIEELKARLAELKARSCAGCSRYLANQYHEGIGACGYLEIDVAEDFGCVKWEPIGP